MVYKELLLDAGGTFAGVENFETRTQDTVLVIGLGGLGIECLKELKREVDETLFPRDDSDGRFQFLAVDSDMKLMQEMDRMADTDRSIKTVPLCIHPKLDKDFLNRARVLSEFSWWFRTEQEIPKAIGKTRQDARVQFIANSHRFWCTVMRALDDSGIYRRPNTRIQVHVFVGMGGTTGSGCFLDACYLVEKILKEQRLYDSALINGYFFTSDVYLSRKEIANAPDAKKWLEMNSNAALADLDRCMNFAYNDECWMQLYEQGYMVGPVKEAPVKTPFLISAGEPAKRSYYGILASTVKYVSAYLKASSCNIMQSMQDQLNCSENQIKLGSKKRQYSVFRNINVEISVKEMMILAADYIFEVQQLKYARAPQDHEVREMAKRLGLTCKDLYLDMTRGIGRFNIPKLDYRDFRQMLDDSGNDEYLSLDYQIREYFENELKRIFEGLDQNRKEMTVDLEMTDLLCGYSGVSRAKTACIILADLVTDPSYGPEYVDKMMGIAGYPGLIDIIYDLGKEVSDRINEANNITKLRIRDVNERKHQFIHAGIFVNRAQRFDEFLASVINYYEHLVTIRVLEQMASLLYVMRSQFESLHKRLFHEYAEVFCNLKETFRQNCHFLKSSWYQNELCGMRILDSERLKSFVMSKLFDKGEELIHDWHKLLLYQPDAWRSGDEKKLALKVSEILKELFGNLSSVNFSDILEWDTQVYGRGVADGYLGNQIIPQMSAYTREGYSKYGIISYIRPEEQVLCIGAGNIPYALQLYQRNDPACRISAVYQSQKISLTRFYIGLSLEEYWQIFRNGIPENTGDGYQGLHIYEGTDRDRRDWRTVPDQK